MSIPYIALLWPVNISALFIGPNFVMCPPTMTVSYTTHSHHPLFQSPCTTHIQTTRIAPNGSSVVLFVILATAETEFLNCPSGILRVCERRERRVKIDEKERELLPN